MTAAATAEAGLPGSAATLPRSDKAGRRIQIATTVVALAIVAVALAPILIQAVLDKPIYDQRAVLTLGNFVKLFTFPELRSMAVDTLLFCAMAIAFSMVIGVALAILLGRTDTPAAGLLLSLLLWPLFISPLVIAFGAIMAYGPSGVVTGFLANTLGLGPLWNLYTIPGIAVISGITMVPATILYCLSAARQQDPAHEAAGRVVGASPARILWRITLPMMRPALIYSTVMNIVAALEMLAIPLILGAPVGIHLFTTFIYERGFESGSPDYGLVAAAAVVLMGLISVLLALQNALLTKTHRFVSIGTRIGRPAHLRLGRWRWVAFGLIALYLVLAVGIIVGTVVLRSFTYVLSPFVSPLDVLTIKNFTDILAVPVYFRSVVNTLAVAAITGTLGTAFFAAIALVSQRSTFRFKRSLDAIVQVPRVLPGIMVGLGVFYASVFAPGFELLRNSIWLLVIAYLVRYMPIGYGVIAPALLQISSDFDRAARVAGAGWSTIALKIVLPIVRPALLACLILLVIQSTKEYAAAVFLYSPGSEVIGSTMLTLWVQGQAGPVAALAVIQIALVTLLIVVATRVLKVKLNG